MCRLVDTKTVELLHIVFLGPSSRGDEFGGMESVRECQD